MHPASVRFSHTHGSASRRRCSYATLRAHKKVTTPMTPAEKNVHNVHPEPAKDHSEAA